MVLYEVMRQRALCNKNSKDSIGWGEKG
jgi:hypothetical protein